MTKFVRVELENKSIASVPAAVAKAVGLEPLDPEKHPAVDRRGRPLPIEFPESADDADEKHEQTEGNMPAGKPSEGRATSAPVAADTTRPTPIPPAAS